MIYSSVFCDLDMPQYPKAIQTALGYLRANDFASMEAGVYEISGQDIFAQVFSVETGDVSEKRPESHEKYLDVQFLATGKEKIGVTNNTGAYKVAEAFEDRDLIFYEAVEHETFMEMVPGTFCVFYPNDIHRPAVANGEAMEVRKVVVKIRIDAM